MLNDPTEPCCSRAVTNRNLTSSASAYKSIDLLIYGAWLDCAMEIIGGC